MREARAQAEALLARSEGDDRPKVEALLRELVESPPPPRVATVTEGAGEGANVAPGTGTAGLVSGEEGKAAAPTSVTVALEFLVEDLRGTPVSDIKLEEVEVVQDATRQRIRTFEAKSRPGRYELTYAPRSGKAGGVTVRVTRRGTVMRGPDGGSSLKPRVISALSPLETELTGVLEARPGAGDLACHVAVLRFEPTASGVRHAVAVEIPLSELRFERAPTGARGRLQVLARARSDVDPAVLQHVTMDQILEAAGDGVVGVQRLVWTGTLVIGPGRHTIDVLVRDPAANRATTRTLAVEVPPPVDGLRVSSVALLRPRSFFFLRDQVQGDDPLVYQGDPLMPTLQPALTAGVDAHLRFYVAVYPRGGNQRAGHPQGRAATRRGEGGRGAARPAEGGVERRGPLRRLPGDALLPRRVLRPEAGRPAGRNDRRRGGAVRPGSRGPRQAADLARRRALRRPAPASEGEPVPRSQISPLCREIKCYYSPDTREKMVSA